MIKIAAASLFLALVLIFLFSGCGPPPPGFETVNVLNYTYETLKELNRYSGDVEGFRNFFLENRNANRVYEFLRNARVEIVSDYGDTYPGVILRSLPNNNLILEQGLYVSEGRKNEALVSLNGDDWYSTRTDFDKKIDNFRNYYNYELEYRPLDRFLYIKYKLSSGFNDSRKKVFVPPWRKVKTIEKGMIFKHPDKDKVNYDLTRRIVYIPPGTVVDPNFRFLGNLMQSDKHNGKIIINILRDIYFYYRGMRVGISFDNEDWDERLFSFKLGSLLEVAADEDRHIKVLFGLYVQYKDEE